MKNFEDESSLSNMTPVASGKLSNAGYYTIPFDKQIALDAGERYAVVLFISTPDAVHPLAIEYEADDATADVVLDDGEGYVSANGFEWENVKMWRIVIFVSKHLVMTVNRGFRGRESNEVCNRDSGSSHDHSVCVIAETSGNPHMGSGA